MDGCMDGKWVDGGWLGGWMVDTWMENECLNEKWKMDVDGK